MFIASLAVVRLPSFLPTKAAEASAAFAGLLAAIVLAVSVQIVTQNSRTGGRRRLSVALAPISFLTLLIAAYLYVRLAGRADATEALLDPNTRQDLVGLPGDVFAAGHVTGALFAVGGALLATGAVAATLLVALAIHETRADSTAQAAGSITFYGAATAAGVFLVDGMFEIGLILSAHERPGGELVSATGGQDVAVVVSALAVVVTVSARVLSEVAKSRSWPSGGRGRIIGFSVMAAALWIVPVAWATVLDSLQTFDLGHRLETAYLVLCFSYYAVAVGLMATVERRSWSDRLT